MNKIWNLILLLFIIILGNVSVFSQNFERFSNKEGFNQNTTHTIEQDRYGFLWYGTPNGLINMMAMNLKHILLNPKRMVN